MTSTLFRQLTDHAARHPDKVALRVRDGEGLRTYTWADYRREVVAVARGLVALGHQRGDCVAIVGPNRPEWVICQLAIMAIGGVPAPIYVTSTAEQFGQILENAQPRLAIAAAAEDVQKYRAAPGGQALTIVWMGATPPPADLAPGVLTLDAVKQRGEGQGDARLEAAGAEATGATSLLIYTSGTTGVPKGVCLSQLGIGTLMAALRERYHPVFEGEYRVVSYLPLCHVAEQIFSVFAHLDMGGEVTFCPDMTKLLEHLQATRPTAFLAVPRVWEKFHAALQSQLDALSGLKAALVRWARATEAAAVDRQVERGVVESGLARRAAEALVLGGLRRRLGLDQLRLAASGAAPMRVDVLRFFASLGVLIHEAYGMSETVGVSNVQLYQRPRFGTVGPVIRGVDVRIGDEGEVQLRGPTMTQGYYRLPDETAALFTPDGWLKTGDVGELDAQGNLRITGRLKDLIITSGGKNVAPVEIEHWLQQIDGVGHAVVVGDRRNYLCALLTLNRERLAALAQAAGVAPATPQALAADPTVQAYLQKQVDAQCNPKVARYQTVKRIAVLPDEFSVDGGELTPTLKLRRAFVNARYAQAIDALYAQPEAAA